MDIKEVSNALFDEILLDIEEETVDRCVEVEKHGAPNNNYSDFAQEDITHREFSGSVRDARLNLEIEVLEAEIAARKQQIMVKQFEMQEARDKRSAALNVDSFVNQVQKYASWQKYDFKIAKHWTGIDVKLVKCQKVSEDQVAYAEATLREMQATKDILERVKLSSETGTVPIQLQYQSHAAALTRLMHREGHRSLADIADAAAATGAEAEQLETQVDSLMERIGKLEARLAAHQEGADYESHLSESTDAEDDELDEF